MPEPLLEPAETQDPIPVVDASLTAEEEASADLWVATEADPGPVAQTSEDARPVLAPPPEEERESLADDQAASAVVRPGSPAPPRRRSFADLEAFVSGKGLAWIGGLAVLIGAVFFMSLAFNRGWVGPGTRVVIGVVASTALILGGAWFFHRREATFGHALVAVGLGIMSLSMVSATRLYDLIPIELGLLGSLLSAMLAAAIAVRFNLQVVAGYGIVAALAATIVLDAEPNGTTIAFLAVTLIGSTSIALYRTWSWLPLLAFILSVVQFINWIVGESATTAGPSRAVALLALGGFWLLYAVSAAGVELRIRRDRLAPSSAFLVVGNAAFAVIAGVAILDGDAAGWRGTFLLAIAIAHGVQGGYFLRTRGHRHPFGVLALGIGIAALTAAVAVQFDGAIVPVAWAAEAVALAWMYRRLGGPFFAGAAAALGVLSILHLAVLEYPIAQLRTSHDGVPFLNADGLALALVLAAGAIAGSLLAQTAVRRSLFALGAAMIVYALPSEVSGWALVAGWASMAVLPAVSRPWRALSPQMHANEVSPWLTPFDQFGRRFAMEIAAGLALALAVGHVIFTDFPIADIGQDSAPTWPFLRAAGASLLFVLVAVTLIAASTRSVAHRRLLGTLALGLLIYAMPFELSGFGLIAAWGGLALAALELNRWPPLARLPMNDQPPTRVRTLERYGLASAALVAWGLTAAHLITINYPIQDIATASEPDRFFLNRNGLSLLISLGTLAIMGVMTRSTTARRVAATAGLALVVYALPYETSGVWLVLGWSIVTILAAIADRLASPMTSRRTMLAQMGVSELLDAAFAIVALGSSILVAAHLFGVELPPGRLTNLVRPATPFVDHQTLAVVFFVAASLLVSAVTRAPSLRLVWRIGAFLVVAYLMPFEIAPAAMAVAWSGLALAALMLGERGDTESRVYQVVSMGMIAGALLATLIAVAPPERLFVDSRHTVDHPFLWSGATAALGSLVIVLVVARGRQRDRRKAQILGIAAGALVVYLLSVGIVDQFQRQVGEDPDIESLKRRAQVALSIFWAVCGGAAFIAGAIRFGATVRLFGLGLLALATVKVFIWDLSTLNTSYRVLSFVGLGTLLLVSSYFYQRLIGAGDRDGRPEHDVSEPLSS